jgi:ribonuclease BN (tRNA processing enzyme)
LTHLHSDHTAGYPDLILTPWVVGRREPLEVYGPKGIKHMTRHILEAYREDILIRKNGMEHAHPEGYLVLLCHKRRRFVCRVQQGQRERFRAMATISLRRIVAIEFGM